MPLTFETLLTILNGCILTVLLCIGSARKPYLQILDNVHIYGITLSFESFRTLMYTNLVPEHLTRTDVRPSKLYSI